MRPTTSTGIASGIASDTGTAGGTDTGTGIETGAAPAGGAAGRRPGAADTDPGVGNGTEAVTAPAVRAADYGASPAPPTKPALPATPALLGRPGARERVRKEVAQRVPIRRVPQPAPEVIRSTWRQAAIPRIERALRASQARNPGGWYVVGASTDLGATSIVRTVAGREVALWRDENARVHAGPVACPHMGARLDRCDVAGADLMCRWHGLRLPSEWPGSWRTLPAHDDGALLWVRLPTADEDPTDSPTLPVRPDPTTSLTSVFAKSARCEPQDIIANRLDPWHGAWFHPYAFSHLVVDDDASTDDCLVTDVTFRLNHTWGVPVRAQFTCPDARTIVMHITEGEGAGSVVETHATPLGTDPEGHPVTVMTEATIGSSPRPGFAVARAFAPLIRPLMVRTQAQLWVDDLEYAQRRYLVRTGQVRL